MLDSRREVLRKSRDRFWSEFDNGEKRALAHAVYELLLLNVDQLKSTYRDVQDFCKDIEPEGLVDNVYWHQKMVHVGWRSVIYPKEFRFVLGHELGHVIFHLEEKSPDLKEKFQCLRNRHAALEGVATDKFLNEDLADLFGSLVEKEFIPDQNYQYSICHWRSDPMSRKEV